MLTTADSGWRDPGTCLWGVFHTTENTNNTPVESVAKWQLNRANGSSYNVLVGTDGRTVRSNDDNYIPWAAGTTGNRWGLHCSAIGYAARTRAQWLENPKQIEAMARWAADLHTRYGLPLVKLTTAEVRARKRGFCGHAEISWAFGEVNHTDPGRGFPWDVVLGRARDIVAGKPAAKPAPKPAPPSQKGTVMSQKDLADLHFKLDILLDQLIGKPWVKSPGWPQLGQRSLVDAVAAIAEIEGVPGCKDTKQ